MIPDDTPDTGPGFLVLLSDPFVAEDVARSITEGTPDARVLCAQSPEAALLMVLSEGNVGVALLQMPPGEVAQSPLGRLLKSTGTRIALAGNAAEEYGEDCPYEVLQRPFSSEQLMRTLQRARAG